MERSSYCCIISDYYNGIVDLCADTAICTELVGGETHFEFADL
jgi:hypothetical protein